MSANTTHAAGVILSLTALGVALGHDQGRASAAADATWMVVQRWAVSCTSFTDIVNRYCREVEALAAELDNPEDA